MLAADRALCWHLFLFIFLIIYPSNQCPSSASTLETRTPSSRPPAGVGSMFSSMATPTGRIRKFLIPASHQSAGASRVRGSPRSGAVPARLEEFRFGTVGAVGGCSDTTDGFSNHWEEKMAIPRQARPGAAGRTPPPPPPPPPPRGRFLRCSS